MLSAEKGKEEKERPQCREVSTVRLGRGQADARAVGPTCMELQWGGSDRTQRQRCFLLTALLNHKQKAEHLYILN